MIKNRVSGPPASEPVSAVEVIEALVLNDFDDDSHMLRCITAARRYCEGYIGYKLMDQEITAKLDAFCGNEINLPYTQLLSVTTISYLDEQQSIQTLSPSIYGVDTMSQPGLIYLRKGESWPEVYDDRDSITIIYRAGYVNAESVPSEIITALIMIVGDLLENREAQLNISLYENPSVNAMLYPYRRHSV